MLSILTLLLSSYLNHTCHRDHCTHRYTWNNTTAWDLQVEEWNAEDTMDRRHLGLFLHQSIYIRLHGIAGSWCWTIISRILDHPAHQCSRHYTCRFDRWLHPGKLSAAMGKKQSLWPGDTFYPSHFHLDYLLCYYPGVYHQGNHQLYHGEAGGIGCAEGPHGWATTVVTSMAWPMVGSVTRTVTIV